MLESPWKWNLNSDSQQNVEAKAGKVQKQNLGQNSPQKKKVSRGEFLREQMKLLSLQIWRMKWERIQKTIVIGGKH